MGGLLLGALAGGIKGVGDGMVELAKQKREDALLAIARSQKVQDQQAEFAHQDSNLATTEAGQDTRLATSEAGANTRNDATEAGANSRNAATIAGQKANTAAEIAGRKSDTAATVAGQKDVANIRAAAYNKKTDSLASQYSTGKPLTYSQAVITARQAYKDNGPITDDNGDAVPADKAISDIANSLMARQPAGQTATLAGTSIGQPPGVSGSTGGGLTSNLFSGGGNPVGDTSIIAPPAAVDITKATATATNPKTGQQIYQIGNQWLDKNGQPVQ